jgi:zinc protease
MIGRHGALAAVLLLIAAPFPLQSQTGQPTKAGTAAKPVSMVADPAVRLGRLPNGLRYAVMQNRTPAGAISVRLAMEVGSYEEEVDELGYAHFIEHLAFRSTRLAPEGVLDNRFAPLGIAFGRDQNAFTGMGSTIYSIDLPTANMQGLGDILDWMRSGAEQILFTPAAVDGERGVLLAELQGRKGPAQSAAKEIMRFQAPGLRSADRDPGGTEESLRAATPARLRAFYDRWYRPENATLVIVGDAPVDALQQLVESKFSGWKARGSAGSRPVPPAQLPERQAEAFTVSNAALPAGVSACRLAPKQPDPEGIERIRRDALSKLWSNILGERLKHASSAAGSPMVGALVMVNHEMPDARATCILMMPVAGKWKEALSAGQAELRRFAAAGPTEAEIRTGVADIESPLYGAVAQQDSRNTARLASDIADAALDHRPFQNPRGAAAVVESVLEGITPAEVRAAFERDWSGVGPLVAMVAEQAPPREALLAAWQANEAATPLAAYADREAAIWAYDFGKPGRVAAREVHANPEFVRIRFSNGVILNFRHSGLEANDVEIRVRFGRGASGLAPNERGPAMIGAGLFPAGGLGKMDFEQIAAVYANTTWRFSLDVPTSAFLLNASTLTNQTAGELRLLAAYMTDPGFRPTIDEKLPTAIDFAYRYLRTEPGAVAMDAMERKVFPGMGNLPPREEMERWQARDFERLLKPALTAAPIEVTIVGDLTEQQAIDAVASSFGALPRRAPLPDRPRLPFRRFPDTLPPPITAFHQGPKDKGAAILIWPLYTATPERRMEE